MLIKRIYMLLFLQGLLFCLFAGCSKPATDFNSTPGFPVNDTTMTDTTKTDTANYTWLALGDSYTIGQSVSESERFPAQTVSLLTNEKIFIKTPQYIATTGWTTFDLLNAIATQKPQDPFDVVTLLIGVNDQYQHLDTSGYRTRFTQCLDSAIALAGNKKDHVFVLSIPDYSVTPFARGNDTATIRKQLDDFNAINKQITLAYNISYTDITPATREAKNDATLIANDGLHPSGKEYAKWADALAPAIQAVLK